MAIKGKSALSTGITGTVGDRVAVRLLQEGAKVRGLVRTPGQGQRLSELGAEVIVGDLTDRPLLTRALQGVELVVHSAAYLGADPELARAVNIDGTRNLAEAALAAGVARFVHISTLSVYGDPNGEIDEDFPLVESHEHPYPITKAQAEREVREVEKRGLPVVILRPGAICAEENSRWGDQLVRRMAAPDWTWDRYFHPDHLVPWVHTDNLVEMVLLAATRDEALGEAYNAIDGNYPVREFLGPLVQALGKEIGVAEGPAEPAWFTHRKILQLGYRGKRSFQETIEALVAQAEVLAAGKQGGRNTV